MPDRAVATALPEFLANQKRLAQHDGLGLQDLTILCRESPVINDRTFTACVPYLEHIGLRSLALAGCAKLSGAPVLALLPALPQLQHLALEATNVMPEYFHKFAPHVRQLVSLKLTHPGPHHPCLPDFFGSLSALISSTPKLESLTLYHSGVSSTGTREWPVVEPDFVDDLVVSTGANLRKFEVSNVLMRLGTIEALVMGARDLRDLVIHIGYELDSVMSSQRISRATADLETLGTQASMDRLASSIAQLRDLKTLHILSQSADISVDDILSLATR